MEKVHVFISSGRFGSVVELRSFIDPAYTQDGHCVPSPFMREAGLTDLEPACIEVLHREKPVAVFDLLAPASFSDQWCSQLTDERLSQPDGQPVADSAICVFPPNRLRHPQRSSLEYVGAFDFADAFEIIEKVDCARPMDGGGVELVIESRRGRFDGSPHVFELLRRKIQFYLDQINSEGFQAVFKHPPPEKTVIVLQTEDPPPPAVVDYVERAKRWVAQNNATLVLRRI